MKPLQTTSGDLLADRRTDYADMLFASAEPAAAAEVMLGALELAPGWALGWFRLGEFHEAAGDLDQAAQAWRMAQKLDPTDRAGAALKLALIGAGPAVAAPPSAFVETLFDQYAGNFDDALVGTLDYRAPQLLAAAIRAAHPGRFGLALDLGCGTGLMGVQLRPIADRLEGIDISAEMLARARAKNIYDRLHKADLQDWARRGAPALRQDAHDPLFAGGPTPARGAALGDELIGRTDLVTAADVFMYVGALSDVFAAIAKLLAPGGLFAFSVERHNGPDQFILNETRRYAHSERYVRRVLAASGFSPTSLTSQAIRKDRGQPVEGLVVLARLV